MILFSIVTVCFNSEKTIKRTIDSVYAQSYSNYEYLIIDGASKDSTIDIVKEYRKRFDGKLKMYSEPDNGIYDAFNKGIRKAVGKYIWLVNSDDYIQPNALELLANFIKKNNGVNYPVICGKMNYIDEATAKVLHVYSANFKSCKICYDRDVMGLIHPATVVSKEVYDKYGVFDANYKLLGDCDWFHNIYSMKVPIVFIDQVLTNMSNSGLTGQWSFKRFIIEFNDRKIYFRRFYPNLIKRFFKFAIWHFVYLASIIKVVLKKHN